MSHQNDPFSSLNRVEPPAPRDDARARALAAASAAFATAQAAGVQKNEKPTQGSAWGNRLMSIIKNLSKGSIMDMRLPIGSLAIALVVLPLGYHLYNSTALTQAPSVVQTEADTQKLEVVPAEPAVEPEVLAEAAPAIAQEAPAAPALDMAIAPPPAPLPSEAIMRAPAPSVGAIATRQAAQMVQGGAPMAAMAENPVGGSFTEFDEQRLKVAAEEPVSTFSLDVDTASYAFTRRALNDGFVPPADAIRIEELINYFPYDYPAPEADGAPFSSEVKIFPTPWNNKTQIMQIGIKGSDVVREETSSNLVFLIDTSGSMEYADKLPLLKRAFALLLDQLSGDDTVSIVTYAGSAGVALEPTSANNKAKIMDALDQLYAGGSTAGAEGIELAYKLAEQAKIAGGTNRVILATDGDFNVGIDDPRALEKFIAIKRDSGISLSVLGFGRGNLDDATMQALAQNGNGNASYISSFAEARKVLVEEVGGTLHTIAKDVKVQVEFNPAVIAEYRLIGYETRALNREDFNNDAVDAGEVGAGTTVTALYEITPVGSGGEHVDPLRYGQTSPTGAAEEIAFLKMRYKAPEGAVSELIEVPITPEVVYGDIADAGVDAQFSAAVAAFGQKLRGSSYGKTMSWDEIKTLAQAGRGNDEGGYRAEFIRLIGDAAALQSDRAVK
ncbi:von Willebrand factor type A domain-containing protein [Devosia sp. MC521]|nr:von Willebrand factor type A domain-containing protein [Devosia sp. MC521]QMW62132.1 von Willebrand factor type A domain-containing protein [Devosia sp. MC521]